MASRYRFIACHATQRTPIDLNLQFHNPTWGWTVGGNGSLSAQIALPDNAKKVEQIAAATEEQVSAIYVQDRATGAYPWGGPVVERSWVPGSSQISITCIEWRGWLHNISLLPSPSSDLLFVASPISGQEQLDLARALVAAATEGEAGGSGCPPYTIDANTSGKLRELTFYASQAKRVGELLDTMANRDGGFEWTLEARPHPTDGLPRLHFLLSYPERGTLVPGLKFKATSGGSNFTPETIKIDASSAYNSWLATGSGTPPDMLFATDADVSVAENSRLRWDGSASYNTVVERATLAAHARRAILFFRSGIQNIAGSHAFGTIDPDSYICGDRAGLLVEDRFRSIELSAVRIIEKTISLAGAGSVSFKLDLSDAVLPEVDSGGAI